MDGLLVTDDVQMSQKGNCVTENTASLSHLSGGVMLAVLTIMLLMSGCVPVEAMPAAAVADPLLVEKASAQTDDGSYLLFNQRMVEGYRAQTFDLDDVDAVFWRVFSGLPDEVTVYPSENYYYFVLYVDGRQIWGNIRLPAGRRERGVLSFGYFEFDEFPRASGARSGISRSKFFTKADGVVIDEIDPLTYDVTYDDKTVTFDLHPLRQEPPERFELGEDEVFVERTFDESGYQFFLLFNEVGNYFIWVLNEEEIVPDDLESLADDLLVGKRSGFAFLVDEAHDNRKVLAAVRRINVNRNDYYDGPFDQLADNDADIANVAEYMQLAFPGLAGRIDKYGYYTDQERPMRVALSTYLTYYAQSDLLQFMEQVRAADDPYEYISKRGIVDTPTSVPTPSP